MNDHPTQDAAPSRWSITKYAAASKMTGEYLELCTSARSEPDRRFRFVWTLAPGKRGPRDHLHEDENEVLQVVSGTIRVWLDDVPKDYLPGDIVEIRAGVRHRFLNPGPDPVVMNVAFDGTKMEDAFVPLAVASHGREPRARDFARLFVYLHEQRPTRPTSPVERAIGAGLARLLLLFGVESHAPVHGWDHASADAPDGQPNS